MDNIHLFITKEKIFSKAEKEGGHYQIDSHSIIDAGIVTDRWSDHSLRTIVEIIIFKSGEDARVIDFMIYLTPRKLTTRFPDE